MAHIAASESIASPIDGLVELLSHRPPEWLEAFLRLCAHEADQVAHRLAVMIGRDAPRPKRLRVRVDLGGTASYGPGRIAVPVQWHAADEQSVLGSFIGCFLIEPSGRDTVLSVEGVYRPPARRSGDPVDTGIAIKAVHEGLRNLLGNLKSAVEELELTN